MQRLEAEFATVDFETNLLVFRVPQVIIESHRWRAGKVQIDATEIMLPLAEGAEPEKDDGIRVAYDLLDQQLKTLGDAIAFLDQDASPKALDRIDGVISVEHLEGLHEMCCAIYEKRPFPERKDSDEQTDDSE